MHTGGVSERSLRMVEASVPRQIDVSRLAELLGQSAENREAIVTALHEMGDKIATHHAHHLELAARLAHAYRAGETQPPTHPDTMLRSIAHVLGQEAFFDAYKEAIGAAKKGKYPNTVLFMDLVSHQRKPGHVVTAQDRLHLQETGEKALAELGMGSSAHLTR